MEVIAEEEEDEEDDDDDADGSSSSGSGTEFVPSAWNSEATPNRSALRSPDKKSVSTDIVSMPTGYCPCNKISCETGPICNIITHSPIHLFISLSLSYCPHCMYFSFVYFILC